MDDAKKITTKELIEVLLTLPQDAVVWTEGCDCYGRADGAYYDPKDNTIVITRSN